MPYYHLLMNRYPLSSIIVITVLLEENIMVATANHAFALPCPVDLALMLNLDLDLDLGVDATKATHLPPLVLILLRVNLSIR